MQGAVCREKADCENAALASEPDALGQLRMLLQAANTAHDHGLHVCFGMHRLVRDWDTRASLLELGPDVFAGEGWLEQLECLERHRKAISGAIAALQFLTNPTHRTLRAVLDDSFLSEAEKRAALDGFAAELEAREEQVESPPMDQVAATVTGRDGRNFDWVVAALIFELGWLEMTDIGRHLELSRSDVYQAVKWFRSLPEGMRVAIKYAGIQSLVQFKARGFQRPEEIFLRSV